MDFEQLEVNPRIIMALKKANLRSTRDILKLSDADLQRLTRLSVLDVRSVRAASALACRKSPPVTALQLHRGEFPGLEPGYRLTMGCPVLDRLLRGGVPLVGITELAGESGAGKTQVGLQLCLTVQYPRALGGLGSGAVFICTEDPFPIKRLRQLISLQSKLRPDLPEDLLSQICFSDNIYIKHTADLGALQTCISKRVPVLLSRGLVQLVVVDSVAALFRCEFNSEETVERARHLQAIASSLHHLSHSFCAPVLCINQVGLQAISTHSLTDTKILPALGMSWANQVLVRLMLRRLEGQGSMDGSSSTPRKLEVLFAPHLPRASCLCSIREEGVRGTDSVPLVIGPRDKEHREQLRWTPP
ncbi:DNA repair protein XRCC3 [Arapaima gigas]